jgi:hypothetical protein
MSRTIQFVSRSKKRLTLVGVIIVALLASAGALAYWTTTGSGSASAQAATAQPVTITAGSPTTQLYPGGTADVAATISNPNSFIAHAPSLQLDTSQGTGGSGFSVDGPHAGCTLSTLAYTTQTNGGAGYVVPAKVGTNNGTLAVDLTGAISMGVGAANACQGATFTVYLKVGA